MAWVSYRRALFVATVSFALALVGCSSTGDKGDGSSGGKSSKKYSTATSNPIKNGRVQAVITTGLINDSAESIAENLEKVVYNFKYDSDNISNKDYKALDVHAAYLLSSVGKDSNIAIVGHTDERGTRTYNLALGERRANAIKRYLAIKGVDESRIEVISYGFEKPINPEHNDEAWSRNRRAELDVMMSSGDK